MINHMNDNVDEGFMSIDVRESFLSVFSVPYLINIFLREYTKQYQQFLENQYIIFIDDNDIGRSIGRDINNIYPRITKSMVDGKLYIKVSEFGATIIEFNEL